MACSGTALLYFYFISSLRWRHQLLCLNSKSAIQMTCPGHQDDRLRTVADASKSVRAVNPLAFISLATRICLSLLRRVSRTDSFLKEMLQEYLEPSRAEWPNNLQEYLPQLDAIYSLLRNDSTDHGGSPPANGYILHSRKSDVTTFLHLTH
jgi:hypothetical protein